jgi:UDP-3-O-[3-hydroxymyristoyl] N-acetylglucosamine deacetylase
VLDVIGDMALLGAPLLGHVIADRSGHGLHLGLMQTLLDNPDCWEYVRLQKKGDTLFQEVVNTTRSASSRIAPLFVPAGKAVTGRPACAV